MGYCHNKNKQNLLILLSFLTFLAGCSELGIITEPLFFKQKQAALFKHFDELHKKYDPYVGVSTEKLLTDFGKPQHIDYEKKYNGYTCDEEWNYSKKRGIPLINQETLEAVWFCIIDEKVYSLKFL